MERHLQAPISKEELKTLKSGDYVYITGTIYTARDAAHKRMYETLQNQENLPIDIQDQIIYYMGPSPAREGRPIGSAGPTTASRMDKYTPQLLDLGMGAMIGKGKRTQDVIDAVIRNGAVYFAAVGGAGALLSKCITKSEFVERFPELSLFYRLFSPLNSEMICIFPYFCPYAESAREIREIFS